MITICHPVDDVELLFVQSALEASDIPHFVVGQHFGSLYPGMQIPWYNERSIRVPSAYVNDALEVVQHLRSTYVPTFTNLTIKSKFRILVETLICGWVIPVGSKKSFDRTFKSKAQQRAPEIYDRVNYITIFLRFLAVVSAFLMMLFFFMPVMVFRYGSAPIRDAIASSVFVVLAILAMRCTKWLWRKRPFWSEINSLSEVVSFASLLLLWPLEALLEQQTAGVEKAIVQITTLLISIFVYVFIQLYGRKGRM